MTVQKYTKRPVTIEATQWDGTVEDATRVIDWILSGGGTARYHEEIPEDKKVWEPDGKSYEIIEARPALIHIDTLEGTMRADKGDFIIRGIKGEHYPCKPDIFEDSYSVEQTPQEKAMAVLSVEEQAGIQEIIRLHDEALRHQKENADFFSYKSQEGAVELRFGTFFDREEGYYGLVQVGVYSYSLGPHRMHHFDSVEEALTEVRKWHENEMNYDYEAERAEEGPL